MLYRLVVSKSYNILVIIVKKVLSFPPLVMDMRLKFIQKYTEIPVDTGTALPLRDVSLQAM